MALRDEKTHGYDKETQSEEIKHNLRAVLGSISSTRHPQEKNELLAIPVPVPKLPAVRPGKTARLCSTAPCWTPGIPFMKKTIKGGQNGYIDDIDIYTQCVYIYLRIYIYIHNIEYV